MLLTVIDRVTVGRGEGVVGVINCYWQGYCRKGL